MQQKNETLGLLLKIVILILYFSSFFYFVILEGVDEQIRAEASYLNSEILSYKKQNGFKKHEYVSHKFVEKLRDKYRESFNKKKTIIYNQENNSKKFSIVILLISLVFIFILKTNYLYILSLSLPFIHAVNQIYESSGYFSYLFIAYPLLTVIVAVIIKYIYDKIA